MFRENFRLHRLARRPSRPSRNSASSTPPGICRRPGASARRSSASSHIPGAVFFDIDAIADRSTGLPHMLPDAQKLANAMTALGLGDGMRFVVYDTLGLFAAARVWWTLRAFGVDDVRILDGGLPKWLDEGRPIETGRRPADAAPLHAAARPRLRRLARRRASGAGERLGPGGRRAAGRPFRGPHAGAAPGRCAAATSPAASIFPSPTSSNAEASKRGAALIEAFAAHRSRSQHADHHDLRIGRHRRDSRPRGRGGGRPGRRPLRRLLGRMGRARRLSDRDWAGDARFGRSAARAR